MKKILGFLRNLLGGAIFLAFLIAAAKWSGWSFGNLLFGPQYRPPVRVKQAPPPHGQVFAAFKEKAWWLAEYRQLNAVLDRAGGKLSAHYRTGPGGQGMVNIELKRGPNEGLTLVVDAPPQSVKSLDEKTGQLVPQDHRNVFTFRDVDLDGMPDQVRMEPEGKPISQESFTEDGFMRVRDSADHTALLVQWTIGLGYCTNHFLHGKESAFP
jgi:hypothetical protein